MNTIASLQREKNEAEEIASDERKRLHNEKLEVSLVPTTILFLYDK